MEGNCTSTITLQSGKQIVSNIKINPTLSKKKCIRNITFTIIKKYKLAIDTWNDVLWRYMKVYFNTGTKILFMTVYIFFINIAVITFFTVLLANPFSLLVFLYPFVVSIYVTSILPYAGFAVCIQEYYKDQEISLIEEQDVAL